MPREHIRIKWKGLQPTDDEGNPTPGFPGEHFAIVPIKDFTDDEYEHELDDEQRAMIASRPDLYEDRGTAEDAAEAREERRAARRSSSADDADRPAAASARSSAAADADKASDNK